MNTASHSMKRRKRSFSHFCYFLSKILSLRSKFKALEVIAGEKNCSNIYPIVFSFISIGKNIRILQSQLMNFGALCFNPGPLCVRPGVRPSVRNAIKTGITLLHLVRFRPNLDGRSFLGNLKFGHVKGHFKVKGHLQASMTFLSCPSVML